jgi:diguanylate cyclase (GGDEF)-like protein
MTDHNVRWLPFAGAVATTVVALAWPRIVRPEKATTGSENRRRAISVVMLGLAMSAVALTQAAFGSELGSFGLVILVGICLAGVIADRRAQLVIAAYGFLLVVGAAWSAGYRGSHLFTQTVAYGATITLIIAIFDCSVGQLRRPNFHQRPLETLNDALDGIGHASRSSADTVEEVIRRGMPLVTSVLPADRAAVFVRHETLGRFTLLAAWPTQDTSVDELATLPDLASALHSGKVIIDNDFCFIPVGYCSDGELGMVIERAAWDAAVDQRATEAANGLATAFLRRTSRANFISGLRAESRTDTLTGLPNARSMTERIEIEMSRALRTDTSLSLAILDLDHFSQFNDEHGPVAGDNVLRSLAACIISNVRAQDLVARSGGEEFCLILPETDIEGGHHVLEALRHGGRNNTANLGVTVSAGLTSWDGIEDVSSLLERANMALERAKRSGRDRVVSIEAYTEF